MAVQNRLARNPLKRTGFILLLFCVIAVALFYFRDRFKPSQTPLPEVQRNELILREGRLYRTNGTIPFVGFMTELYEGGSLKSRSAVSNGLLNGLSEGWHTNGVIAVTEHFTNGVSHGTREKWHENKNKSSEAIIAHGKIEGLFRRWHENGQLAEQIEMKDGEPDGTAWSYYPSGFLKGKAVLEKGTLIEKESWNDGELKSPPAPEK